MRSANEVAQYIKLKDKDILLEYIIDFAPIETNNKINSSEKEIDSNNKIIKYNSRVRVLCIKRECLKKIPLGINTFINTKISYLLGEVCQYALIF